MSTSETITKTDLKNILEAAGNIGSVDSTAVPTASKVSEFDAAAQMNSTDMTSSEVTSFVEDLNIEGGGSGTPIPTANTTAAFDSTAHMNSSDMTSTEIDDFVEDLGIGDTIPSSIVDFFYPVGSYYETSDTTFNPNIRWGGTWVLETEGQVHVSAGLNYEVGGALTNETDGGEATVTLTVNEMPSHNHTQDAHSHQIDNYLSTGATATWTSENVNKKHGYDHWTSSAQPYIQPKGGGQPHENMPPYIIVNRWHRTA